MLCMGKGGSTVCAAATAVSGAWPHASIAGAAWGHAGYNELVGTHLWAG